jgi:hypothetical protein
MKEMPVGAAEHRNLSRGKACNCLSAASFARAAWGEKHREPFPAGKGQGRRVPFLLGTSLWARKEKYLAPRQGSETGFTTQSLVTQRNVPSTPKACEIRG